MREMALLQRKERRKEESRAITLLLLPLHSFSPHYSHYIQSKEAGREGKKSSLYEKEPTTRRGSAFCSART